MIIDADNIGTEEPIESHNDIHNYSNSNKDTPYWKSHCRNNSTASNVKINK